jgi:hypothetical protein
VVSPPSRWKGALRAPGARSAVALLRGLMKGKVNEVSLSPEGSGPGPKRARLCRHTWHPPSYF